MSDLSFTPLIGSAVGGIIAATSGLLLAKWKRQRDGRDQFLSTIAEIEADLDNKIFNIQQLYADSLPKLRTAIFAVRPFVKSSKFEQILNLWQIYKNVERNQIDPGRSRALHTIHDLESPNTPNPYQLADDWMRAQLIEFRNKIG